MRFFSLTPDFLAVDHGEHAFPVTDKVEATGTPGELDLQRWHGFTSAVQAYAQGSLPYALSSINGINGTNGDDLLTGTAGNDTLDGGAGNDTLQGGLGNDTYIVDSALDQVQEAQDEGIDFIQTSVSYTMPSNVEEMLLTGTAAINGTGNKLPNWIVGNIGNNVLNGRAGGDFMAGLEGDDTYVVENLRDQVQEREGEGNDLVEVYLQTYTLPNHVERLQGYYSTNDSALGGNYRGNNLNNWLGGTPRQDTIDGGGGDDTMAGGNSSDTYIVDSVNDQVQEAYNEGRDFVKSSVSFVLPANVEELLLTGNAAINGTGNAHDNWIVGNNNDNILDGGIGVDWLAGGGGQDTFRFSILQNGYNYTIIGDFDPAEDMIALSRSVFTSFGSTGLLSPDLLVAGPNAVALDANDYLVYNSSNKSLYYDADGNGAGQAVLLLRFPSIIDLSYEHIVII